MSARPRSVRFDDALGFHRLDPVPEPEELAAFYGEDYYGQQRDGERRAPDLARLTALDEAAAGERRWRYETIYPDLMRLVAECGVVGGRALDVGCGTGELVAFLARSSGASWQAAGIELAGDAVAFARSRGLAVTESTVGALSGEHDGRYDLVTMLNVLEHVPDPIGDLGACHRILRPGGALVVQVPNDFSLIQAATREHLGVDPWWVAIPDHINYFDFDSLEATVGAHGFEPAARYATFPMEFYLLAGLDYLSSPDDGARAHHLRCSFESGISADTRRSLYRRFAEAGLGRNCIVVARRR